MHIQFDSVIDALLSCSHTPTQSHGSFCTHPRVKSSTFSPPPPPCQPNPPCLSSTCSSTWPLRRPLRLHEHRELPVHPLCQITKHLCVQGSLPGRCSLRVLHLQLPAALALPRRLLPPHLLQLEAIGRQPVVFGGKRLCRPAGSSHPRQTLQGARGPGSHPVAEEQGAQSRNLSRQLEKKKIGAEKVCHLCKNSFDDGILCTMRQPVPESCIQC